MGALSSATIRHHELPRAGSGALVLPPSGATTLSPVPDAVRKEVGGDYDARAGAS